MDSQLFCNNGMGFEVNRFELIVEFWGQNGRVQRAGGDGKRQDGLGITRELGI